MCIRDREIATELGISIKTVEHQISKALKTLRETAIKIYTFFFGVCNSSLSYSTDRDKTFDPPDVYFEDGIRDSFR